MDAESVEKLGEKSRDEILEALAKYLDSPAPFTMLVLEAAALDGRQKFFKLLSEKALVVELTIGGESAAALATQMAKDLGAEIDREAAALLADILNGEPARMRMRNGKARVPYALGRGRITAGRCRGAGGRGAEEYRLAACRYAGEPQARCERSRSSIISCAKASSPSGIVGALAWTYRKLIEARDLPAHTGRLSSRAAAGHAPGRRGNGGSPGASHPEEANCSLVSRAGRSRQPVEIREPRSRAR